MARASRATIVDVARAAGVSAATVSRVLNGTAEVSPVRVERVLAAVDDLGYQPFSPARALRRGATAVWAVIVADIENPFFTSVVRGIEDGARAFGHRVVLCNSDEDPVKEAEYLEVAIAERMAGVVIALASSRRSSLEPLHEHGIPVVAIDRRPSDPQVESVLVDNRLGAAEATTHLIEGGSRRIACITGPRGITTATDRLGGYRDALAAGGLAGDDALVRREEFRPGGGYEAAYALLGGDDPPDALFVANNLMTLGALQAIRTLDRRIPEDVAIVGWDDAPWAPLSHPPLTVVAQPTREIGRIAAEILGRPRPGEAPRRVKLQPTLVVRESSVRGRG